MEGYNGRRLEKLPGPSYEYLSMDSAGHDVEGLPISNQAAQILLEKMIAQDSVTLKVKVIRYLDKLFLILNYWA